MQSRIAQGRTASMLLMVPMRFRRRPLSPLAPPAFTPCSTPRSYVGTSTWTRKRKGPKPSSRFWEFFRAVKSNGQL